MIFPRDFAEIIERREMGGGGKIGEAERVASEPAPLLGEMANIGQMIAQILMSGAHCLHVRGGAFRPKPAKDLLLDEIAGHLILEFAVEPVHQPPHLGPRCGIARKRLKSSSTRDRLAEIFGG